MWLRRQSEREYYDVEDIFSATDVIPRTKRWNTMKTLEKLLVHIMRYGEMIKWKKKS